MCHISPLYPWGQDYELEELRRRLAQLERQAEKARLRRRIEELERQVGPQWPAFPLPNPFPGPKYPPRNADELIERMKPSVSSPQIL